MLNSELDLFTPKAYQGELLGYQYRTITGNFRSGPVVFKIENSKDYVDLSDSILRLTVKVSNYDGTKIGPKVNATDDTELALVNNAMHSIFSDVEIKLNDKRIEGGRDNYPYKAYINTIFRLHENTMKNQTFTQGWVKDQHDKMDDVKNTAFVARKAWTFDGAQKEFFGRLEADFFKQDRLLLPGVDLEVTLERAKPSFSICTSNISLKPQVDIVSAQLQLKIVKVNPAIMATHAEVLQRNVPAIYPINRTIVEYIPLETKDKYLKSEKLFGGYIPKYMIMAMVPKEAYHGDYTKNPFNFKHYNLCSIALEKDHYLFPYEKFKPDFKNKKCLREYISLYESNGIFGRDETLPISYEEFLEGYTHFQWNLTANANGMNYQPDERGNLTLHLEFAEGLPEPVNVILFGVFDGTIYLNGEGNVITDYDS